jgi:transcriptional regulator with XRE-family HTH domain
LPVSEFRDLLETAARRFPTKHAFARALGITPGRLSRVLGGEHSLDVLNCLKLAKLTGLSASEVLRVAGKGDIADLLEDLYGHARPAIPPSIRVIVEQVESLPPRARNALERFLENFVVDIDHVVGVKGAGKSEIIAARLQGSMALGTEIRAPAASHAEHEIRRRRIGSQKKGR